MGGNGRVKLVLALVVLSSATACRSPVPFHGRPGPDAPVLAIGGPAPYVRPRVPVAPRPDVGGEVPDVYAATQAGMFSPAVRRLPPRVYVPAANGTTVDVIDARTYRVVRRIRVGRAPQHVVPSWDLKTLWVTEAGGLVPIDPRTGRAGRRVAMPGPYDLYFTLDGHDALVMYPRAGRIELRDPHTMRRRDTIAVPCAGLTRADFTADGSSLVAGCAGSGRLVRVDMTTRRVTGVLRLGRRAEPQDVRLSPDGTTFYVADMGRGGVWTVDATRFHRTGFIPTGRGAHGLYPSRDASTLFVTNRDERTVSQISFDTARVVARRRVPTPPDMGGISADGHTLWLSARTGNAVYALSTRTGRLLHRIPVAHAPHGLCVYPQPGRFSLGNTGSYR